MLDSGYSRGNSSARPNKYHIRSSTCSITVWLELWPGESRPTDGGGTRCCTGDARIERAVFLHQLHKSAIPASFRRNQGGVEVDFFCETPDGFAAIEVKASERWETRYNRGFMRVKREFGQNQVARYGVHPGKRPTNWDGIRAMPTIDFPEQLWNGEILPA